jgi:hypothetical protein
MQSAREFTKFRNFVTANMSLHFNTSDLFHCVVKGDMLGDGTRIKSVKAYVVDGKSNEEEAGGGGDCHRQKDSYGSIIYLSLTYLKSLDCEHPNCQSHVLLC